MKIKEIQIVELYDAWKRLNPWELHTGDLLEFCLHNLRFLFKTNHKYFVYVYKLLYKLFFKKEECILHKKIFNIEEDAFK